jgi:hypothetical protein
VVERLGELVLLSSRTQIVKCSIADIGYPYSVLLKKFRTPFPGHSHAWMARRFLDEPSIEQAV